MKKSRINENLILPIVVAVLLIIWQIVTGTGLIPSYLLPSPVSIVKAFFADFILLMESAVVTLWEAFVGLLLSVILGVALAIAMDRSRIFEKVLSPLLLFTQTVPPIAIAPLLILWLGYGVLPKIVLVFFTCFFPITIGTLGGMQQVDKDTVVLLKSMGASKKQMYLHLKLPSALPEFLSGLRISATYALVSAVVAEWLGGNHGLGVYMTRAKKSFKLDKMFAVIFLISLISILVIMFISYLEKKLTPWNLEQKAGRNEKA